MNNNGFGGQDGDDEQGVSDVLLSQLASRAGQVYASLPESERQAFLQELGRQALDSVNRAAASFNMSHDEVLRRSSDVLRSQYADELRACWSDQRGFDTSRAECVSRKYQSLGLSVSLASDLAGLNMAPEAVDIKKVGWR